MSSTLTHVYASSVSIKEYYKHIPQTLNDTDNDGLSDSLEKTLGLSIINPDTDGDGYSDAEEYNDYGTDPLVPAAALFSQNEPAGIRLVSLPKRANVEGTSIYLKGLFHTPDTVITTSFESDTGLAFNVILKTDERGVFHQIVSLDGFCTYAQNTRFTITYKDEVLSTITLHCRPESYGEFLSSVEFNEQIVQPSFNMKPVTVIDNLKQGFRAQLTKELDAKGYFSSIVTSAQMLSDTSVRTIAAYPSQSLEKGPHQFILTMREPIHDTYYDPLVIPFEIIYDQWGYLKTYMYAGGSTSAAALVISAMGVIYIRKHNKAKRRRVYEGDY